MSFSAFILVCVLALTSTVSVAAIPHEINYQGRLVDSTTGESLPGGHTMKFRIYDAASLGAVLWSEEQVITADTTGVVSVILGSVTPIDISFDGRLWLEVEVDTEILAPRRELVSVPYAFHAMDSDSLGGLHSDSYSLVGHTHDDRYYTETELDTSDGSDPNTGSNLVHWDNLNGVPVGFVDGVDDEGGGAGDGHSLDADDGSPVDAVYVDSSGEVGIGTTSPQEELHVAGDIRLDPAGEIEFGGDFTKVQNLGDDLALAADDDLYLDADDDVYIRKAGSLEWVRFDGSNTRLGIGTTSPAKRLHVAGDIRLDTGGDVQFGGIDTRVYEAAGDLSLASYDDIYLRPVDDIFIRRQGGLEWVRFDNDNERLGLGTTSPQKRLHVAGDIRLDTWSDIEFGSDNTQIFESGQDLWLQADRSLYLRPDANVYIRKGGDASSWVAFDSDSKTVGIGTNFPDTDLEILADSWVDIVTLGKDSPNKLRFSSGTGYASISGGDGSPQRDDIVIAHATGEIGIGTTLPDAKLDVVGRVTVTGNMILDGILFAEASTGMGQAAGWFEDLSSIGSGLFVSGEGEDGVYVSPGGQGMACTGYDIGAYIRGDRSGNNEQRAIHAEIGTGDHTYICYRTAGGLQYDVYGTGGVAFAMPTSKGDRTLVAPASPEPWIEDYGSGEIVDGVGHVDLDPLYLDCVTAKAGDPLKVFIELTSPLVNHYYIEKGLTGFEVIVVGEDAKNANATFDYRVVSGRKGREKQRFEEAAPVMEAMQVHQAKQRPVVEEAQMKDQQ
jgi:hypothetical protein